MTAKTAAKKTAAKKTAAKKTAAKKILVADKKVENEIKNTVSDYASENGFSLTPPANNLPIHIVQKVVNRARRYFDGESIHHRVVKKDENSITFVFNRASKKYTDLGYNTQITVERIKSPIVIEPVVAPSISPTRTRTRASKNAASKAKVSKPKVAKKAAKKAPSAEQTPPLVKVVKATPIKKRVSKKATIQ